MNSKLCSIIIPVYNDWQYLHRLLERLLHLNGRVSSSVAELFNIIVVNDGSAEDQSDSLPQSPLVSCFSKPNGGVSSARNFGLAQAQSDFIMFLDCDDDVPDNVFDILYRDLHGSTIDVIQYSYVKHVGAGQDKLFAVKDGEGVQLFKNLLLKKNSFHICSFVFSRHYLNDNHIRFDQSIGLSEDVLFVVEALARTERSASHQEVIYAYNARPDSVIASFKGKREVEHLHAFSKIQHIINTYLTSEMQSCGNFFLKTCIANLYLRSTKLAMKKDGSDYERLLQQLKEFYRQIGSSRYPLTGRTLFIMLLELTIRSRAYYRISKRINRGYYG
ncbi:glycosyltransferase family 2 protein [Shewanella sp.]|uniref:glycosyltransferase family 2 protein n=1 Tax=Shewanella sp. TaxID=50422 RepID=UPI003A98838E